MNIYYTRHGQTDWNSQGKIMGRTDIDINENGIKQAVDLSSQLVDIKFTRVLTSPLKRAVTTAKLATRGNNIIEPVDELIERNFGVYEGLNYKENEQVFKEVVSSYFNRPKGGESLLDVTGRIYPFLNKIIKESSLTDNILLVAHGGISRVVNSYFNSMTNDEFDSFFIPNCHLIKYEIN